MIIIRQKNYSWDEIKRATKFIGKGALIGAGSGAFLGRKQLTKKDNPKGFLLGTGIGAAVGAGIGTAAYISDYKNRKEDPHRKEVDNMIRSSFSWAIEYLKDLSEKIKKENKKLEELSKKLSLDEFASDQIFFDNPFFLIDDPGNYLSDYIIYLDESEDTYLGPKKDRYIEYNETTNELELCEGHPNHSPSKICSIKNKSQLRSTLKRYYFDEILSNLDNIMNHYGAYSLDYGEYSLMTENPDDLSEEQYYKALDTYCNEIKRFIKTL